MLREIKKILPEVYKIVERMPVKQNFKKLWRRFPSLSIDYAVMEKSKKLVLIPADYGWFDLGNWQGLKEFMKKDKAGNIFRGNVISLDCKNILVWSDKRLVAAVGLKDVLIVDTKDALLVCSKNRTQDVKRVVQILKQKKLYKQL